MPDTGMGFVMWGTMYYDCTIHELPTVCNDSYSVLYIDFPWSYDDRALAGNRGAGCKYDLMTDAELLALGPTIQRLTAPDCACFMWATYPKLAEALAMMRACGFTYKTVAFTWVKTTAKSGTLFWGMGRWTRANAEIVLLGVKGKPQRQSAAVHQVVMAPFQGHSVKPDEVRRRIVTLLGDVPRIELFARGDQNDGWDRFGNAKDFVMADATGRQQALPLPAAA